MARPHQTPLTPANAGAQIIERGVSRYPSSTLPTMSQPYDLGPGIRRDERSGGEF